VTGRPQPRQRRIKTVSDFQRLLLFGRDVSIVLSDSWNGKDIAVAVPALPGRQDLAVTQPMACSQPLRNDDVQDCPIASPLV